MKAKILSAGVVILHWCQDHYQYLLLRAYNYWDFPKGMVESGETPLKAAVREVNEETCITDLNFRWGPIYRETPPYNHGRKVARYYIAETSNTQIYLPVNPQLGRPEHNDYRWVTRDDAWTMLTPRVQAILEWTDVIIATRSKH
jgi:8-oxo-dGTP pyrophosphatase MutT (NUDIX family)